MLGKSKSIRINEFLFGWPPYQLSHPHVLAVMIVYRGESNGELKHSIEVMKIIIYFFFLQNMLDHTMQIA